MSRILLPILASALLMTSFTARAQSADGVPYTEGAVVVLSYIRIEPGMFDEYMRYLAGTYKKVMDEYKEKGIIQDWGVYNAFPRSEDEPDLILTVAYKNWAALDGLRERTDPIAQRVWGSLEESAKQNAARGKMRTSIGTETLQRLELK